MSASRLRERGIYRLPNGQKVVVSECGKGEYCLFTTESWGRFGLAEYLLDKEGRILKNDIPTGWGIGHLVDTEQTAPYYVLGELSEEGVNRE